MKTKIIAHEGGNGSKIKPCSYVVKEETLRNVYQNHITPLNKFLKDISGSFFEYYGHFEIVAE